MEEKDLLSRDLWLVVRSNHVREIQAIEKAFKLKTLILSSKDRQKLETLLGQTIEDALTRY